MRLVLALTLTTLAGLALPMESQAQPGAPAYTVVDLGVLDQGATTVIRGLNNSREIVGGVRSGGRGHRAFLLSGGRLDVIDGRPGTDWSTAAGINDAGVVVGASNAAAALRGFRFTRTDGVRELSPLPDDAASQALGVNRHGQVVGLSSGPRGVQAVLWSPTGAVQGLGTVAGDRDSRALAVNEAGTVVGRSQSTDRRQPFVWTRRDGMSALPLLPGHTDGQALALNSRGEVVGESAGGGEVRAILWTAGALRDLGTLAGGRHSRALAINEHGDVVGAAEGSFGTRAFLWTAPGGMRDLNGLIPSGSSYHLTQAVGINDAGVVLAVGHDAGIGAPDHDDHESPVRVFLLVPRP